MEPFEIHLRETPLSPAMIFAAPGESDAEVVLRARELLKRHPQCKLAEIWHDNKLLRQI